MKKAKPNRSDDDFRPEYDLTKLQGGVRGKHFKRFQAGTNLALLAADVRAAFPTDDGVNKALRAVMRGKKQFAGKA